MQQRAIVLKAAPAQRAEQRECLLVLGMHRSGTSAATRVINLLGARLPRQILGPGPANVRGHWEPEKFVTLHENWLESVGSSWDDWRPLDVERVSVDKWNALKHDAVHLFDEEYGTNPGVITLKDPRICRFASLYAEIFAEAGITPRYVIPVRNPLAVAASLSARDGIDPHFAILLWLRHVLDAEAATRGAPRAILSYEALLDDWRSWARRVSERTGVEWRANAMAEVASEVESFLSRDLQHNVYSYSELDSRSDLASWVTSTYDALRLIERESDTNSALAILDTVRAALNAIAPILGEAFYGELANRRRSIRNLESEIARRDDKVMQLLGTLDARKAEVAEAQADLERKVEEFSRYQSEMADAELALAAVESDLERKADEASRYRSGKDDAERALAAVYDSTSWRVTAPLRSIARTLRNERSAARNVPKTASYSRQLLERYRRGVERYGFFGAIPRGATAIYRIGSDRTQRSLHNRNYNKKLYELRSLIEAHEGFVDLMHVALGWNTPLFQRFQHMSLQASRLGALALYGGHRQVDKNLVVYERTQENVVVFEALEPRVMQCIYDALLRAKKRVIVRIQSIDLATRQEEVEWFSNNGFNIVYEYIDEISEEITGVIPEFVRVRHEMLLRDERVLVVATSDALFAEVAATRTNNFILSTNGVDVDHWRSKPNAPPSELVSAVQSGRTIVGYHGALAQWLDYNLLRKIADDGSYELVLIGCKHDSAFDESGLAHHPRVHFLGSKSYFNLNRYAAYYDIGIVPFKSSTLTDAVSPVKLYEYMAAGAAVVTTDMAECRKYPSVHVAVSHEDFLQKLRAAADAKDSSEYAECLASDAMSNSWRRKAEEVFRLAGAEVAASSDIAASARDVSANRDTASEAPANGQPGLGAFSVASQIRRAAAGDATARRGGKGLTDPSIGKGALQAFVDQVLEIPSKTSTDYVPLARDCYIAEPTDPKIIAYYLPQFHPTPENDEWWGRGTTEWNNVSRAMPQYVGHYQPRFPGELGYYDLRIADVIKRQMELARIYGVSGFAYYYYWFDGRRLLDKPLETMLKNRDLSLPFCLCWANESWTRRFDGTCGEILMEQSATTESYAAFIDSVLEYMRDPRYIRVANRPVLIIYRPSFIPDCKSILAGWRKRCRDAGVGDPYLIGVREHTWDADLLACGFDAQSEFHPGTLFKHCKDVTRSISYLRRDFGGTVLDYRDIVEKQRYFEYNHPKLFRAAMPMWDNTARRDNRGMIFEGSTPELYERWLSDICAETKRNATLEEPFVFINAWNEWGEGAYLEPDRRYGYAYLAATRRAIEGLR